MLKKRYDSTGSVVCLRPCDRIHIPAPVGDVVEKEYRVVRDSHFNAEYVEVGEKDIQEYINSFQNGCSLKSILDRCAMMPIHDKVRYLQQTDQGFSADLTSMPKDGTEAQIMIQRVKAVCPNFAQRMRDGESFEKILLDFIPKSEEAPAPAQTNESEVPA